jgi:hypothetical protein
LEILPITAFSPSGTSYRGKCKSCCAALVKEKRRDPKVRALDYERSRKWREKNRKKHSEMSQDWARQNPEKKKLYQRTWAEKHPKREKAINAAKSAKRRARELQATPPWVDYKEILDIYEEAQRLSRKTGVERHVDHIIPLAGKNVCGLHVAENLQILTVDENRLKWNHHESDVDVG